MRNIPGYPTNTDVLEPIARVVHGGKDRDIEQLSISRSLPSSFHAQVAGVGGLTQATGKVTWSALSDVVEAQPTAFGRVGGWPPRVRDRVDVYTGYRTATGDLLAKQLTGAISGSNGDPLESVESGMVDPIARLSRKVNLPPLLNNMPPLTEGGPWRGVGLYPTFFTDAAARAGGFNSTPGMAEGCVFSAPLMGSAWPERGTLVTGLRYTDRNNANAIWQTPRWGMGVSNAFLSYQPSGASRLDRPMEITAMFEGTGGEARVGVNWGGATISIYRNVNGIQAQLFNSGGGIGVCTLDATGTDVVTLRIVPNGSNLTLTLRDSLGREAIGAIPKPNEAANDATEVIVHSTTDTMTVGGVQVAFPSVAWSSVGYTRSAFITPAAHNASFPAFPPLQDVTARSILEDQATAELAAVWIDGDGFLRWVNRDRLTSGNPVTTLTSRDHLKSLSWEEDFAAMSSMVEVTSRQAGAINQFKYPRQEVWRSNYGKVVADGTERFEELLHPDADEDWIMVDTAFNNNDAAANEGRGSDIALYEFVANGEPNEGGYATMEYLRRDAVGATLQQVDHRTYKLLTLVFRIVVTTDEAEHSLQVPTERQGIFKGDWPASIGGVNFPVIRAHAKVMWTDTTYTATAGAWDAPVLTHDVGPWVQDPGACQAVANLLAAQTSAPRPYLSGVSIVPDARLERGDIVTLSDPDITGIEFRCLVVGIEDSFTSSPTRWEQSCDFRVLGYTVIGVTLDDLDLAWAGQLLTALDAARTDETLAQFDATPLKGAPQ